MIILCIFSSYSRGRSRYVNKILVVFQILCRDVLKIGWRSSFCGIELFRQYEAFLESFMLHTLDGRGCKGQLVVSEPIIIWTLQLYIN